MADIASVLYSWSATAASNNPSGTTSVATGLDDNLREIQKVVRGWLATKGANIASATTTDLGAIEGLSHTITGTTTITSFGTVSAGIWKVVIFAGALTLTHNATSLILPGGANITTAANDVGIFQSEGTGNWRCWGYIRATGLPIVNPTTAGPFSDANSLVENSSDGTKELRLRANNITTATTRQGWILDEDQSLGNDWEVRNGSFTASASGNAMTMALKTKAGNDPSATDPVFVQFRSATATDGKPVVRTVTAAISVTLSSGSTLGTANATEHRIYGGLADDGGTVRMFAYNPLLNTGGVFSLQALNENNVNSSTAEGGAGGADTAQVLYSTTAFTAKAIRLIGYFESTQTTAGTWATQPSYVHTLKHGDYKTGDLVQTVRADFSNNTNITATTPALDDTVPQISEGTEVMTLSASPRSGSNILTVTAKVVGGCAANSGVTAALFKDAVSDCFTASPGVIFAGGISEHHLNLRVLAGSTSSATWRVRVGLNSATTYSYNGSASARLFGTTPKSFLQVDEIFA